MIKIFILIICLIPCLFLFGQTFSERKILTDTKDSIYINSTEIAFDKQGNYCIVSKIRGLDYFVTNYDTIGGVNFIGSIYGQEGVVMFSESALEPNDKPFYYKNGQGVIVYGTAIGQIDNYTTSNTKNNIAIATSFEDSAYYYINGKLISRKYKKNKNTYYVSNADWCAFSENGNTIYSLQNDSIYFLYVNGKQIDSSRFEYIQLAINEHGDYVFAKGNCPEKQIGKYNYMFYVHTKDTSFNYVRTVWNYELKENGAYYYSGDDNGSSYIAINGLLHRDIKYIDNITLIDKTTFMYFFDEQGKNRVNVRNKMYTLDFDKIYYPILDKKGNFAFYGQKDYYLYKYINGKQSENPISKYNVRPTPLYISPEGESIHYFQTDDSIYLYRDDKLLFNPILKTTNFNVLPHKDFIPYNYIQGKSENGNSLFYLEYESKGYIVYNGTFSNPMKLIDVSSISSQKKYGEIVAGEFNDDGFFAIQKIGKSKYLINVNNIAYKQIENIDKILKGNCFFNGKELIFYGFKGLSIYQFKLVL